MVFATRLRRNNMGQLEDSNERKEISLNAGPT